MQVNSTQEAAAGLYEFERLSSATSEDTVRIKTPDGKFYLLHSAVDPVKEANMLVESVDTSKSALYFVFGIGLGYHLRVLKEKITPSSRVVVLEPEREFVEHWKKEGILGRAADNRFSFIGGDVKSLIPVLDKLLRGKQIMVAGNCRFLVLPAYNRLFREWVRELQTQIINLIRNRVFEMGNDVFDTLIGIRQVMLNLWELVSSPGANDLLGAYKGKPAIIVSAGPSLNKNVDFLHEVKGKALILCVDASLNVLLEKGIIPDAVLSIERGVETYNQFYKGKNLPKEPVLIAPAVIHPRIFDEYPGEKVVLLRANEGVNMWFERILNKGMVKMGTSVAHLAFGFARLVKAEPIIFIGQDLAYSPEGYSHGHGVSVNKKVDFSKVEAWVEGYDGQKLPSTRIWKNFLTWFETAIAETGALCIDATEGGARIKGTEIMTLKEAIAAYCRNSRVEPLKNVIQRQDVNVKNDLENILQAFSELIDYFNKLSNRAVEGLELLGRVEKKTNFNKGKREKLLKAVKKISRNDQIVHRITQNAVAVMCFQTMLFIANHQLAELGDRLTPENVLSNIKIQRWFLERVWKVSEKIVAELEDILEAATRRLDKNLKAV